MKPIARLATIAAGALGLAASAHAQSLHSESGLLGRRHAGVDLTYVDHTGSTLNKARGASADFNTPVTGKMDLGFGYEYSYVSGNNYSVSGNTLNATLLGYERTEYGKVYLAGTLGHAWDHVKTPGLATRDNGAVWALRAGCETPINDVTAVNASLGFSDAFNGRTTRNPTLEFRVEANHWFTGQVAGVVSAAYRQIKRMPDAALYSIGLRWTM